MPQQPARTAGQTICAGFLCYQRSQFSILFEFQGKRLTFLGDSWADKCLRGFAVFEYSPEHPCEAALIKLSHHESPHNLSEELA